MKKMRFRAQRCPFQFSTVCHILLASLIWIAIGSARGEDAPSSGFRSGAGWPLPNVDLPDHVVAPEGQISVFADFVHPVENGCPLYLINRTDKAISIPVQDGSLRVALAVKMSEGVWQQSQVHEYSDCGNSYYSLVLPPGQHFKSIGYQPKTGIVGKVRYQFFRGMDDLVSNEGAGYWDEKDLAANLKTERVIIPLEQSLSALIDEVPARMEGGVWTKAENAMLWLELAGRYRQDPVYFSGIERVRGLIKTTQVKNSGKLAELTARLDSLASRQPPGLSSTALRQECEEIIRSAPSTSDLVAGKPHRAWVAWETARWLIRNESTEEKNITANWSGLYNLAQQRLSGTDVYESRAIGNLLRNTRLTSEHVKTAFLVAHSNSPIVAVSDACLNQLAERQMYQQLAEIGMKASPELRLRLLRWFCAKPRIAGEPGRLRDGVYELQQVLWEKCIHENPWGSMNAMQSGVGYGGSLFLEPWLSLLFRDCFTMLLASAETGNFPIQSQEQLIGVRKYVEILNRDPGSVSIRLLKRAAGLIQSAPAGEPEANAEARKNLAYSAGRELRIEEFFR